MTGRLSSRSPAATRSPLTPCSPRPACAGGGSRSTASTSCWAAAATTAPGAARRRSAGGAAAAAQCGGDDVVVIGAGNSAGQAVMSLGDAGARVTMVVRGEDLSKSMSAYLVERIERHPLIDVRLRSQVTALHERGGELAAVTITDAGGA